MFYRTRCFLFSIIISTGLFAAQVEPVQRAQLTDASIGSWIFSGMVRNESGDKYGYFFEMQRQGADFYTKAALVNEETNQLVFFSEEKEKIEQVTPFDWHVGHAFLRYNPINDRWIFGVKAADKKGFNFKVDMLKQVKNNNEILELRPGVKFQVVQTSQLNGHLRIDDKEQFITGNKAWFGKLALNNDQKDSHEIRSTFCRLNDENGFYSANLKEKDASSAAVAGWLDPLGKKIKMSQFISIKSLNNDLSMLSVGLPKLNLKLINSLKTNDISSSDIAGFSKDGRGGFCFVTKQLFLTDKLSKPADDAKLIG